MSRQSSWIAWALGLAAVASLARSPAALGAPRPEEAVLWDELAPLPAGPVLLSGATWFEPPPAVTLRLLLEPRQEEPPLVWRARLDPWGRVQALEEMAVRLQGEGMATVWIPPSPRAALAVLAAEPAPDGRARVRAFVPEPATGPRELDRWWRELWRQAARPDRFEPAGPPSAGAAAIAGRLRALAAATAGLGDREARAKVLRLELLRGRPLLMPPGTAWSVRRGAGHGDRWTRLAGGPLDLDVRGPALLVVEIRAVASGREPQVGRPIPFRVVVRDGAGREVADGATRALLHPAGDGQVEGAVRRLEVLVPEGRHRWTAEVEGADADVRARAWSPRQLFPLPPDGPRAIALGRRAGTFLVEAPASGGNDGEAQAGLLALERAVRALDLGDGPPAGAGLRAAAREAWLQGTAWTVRGVVLPPGADSLLRALPGGAAPGSAEGQPATPRRLAFLTHGRTVDVEAPAHPADPSRWAVVRWIGVNLSRRTAVAAIEVDGSSALRAVLPPGRSDLRIALSPGPHQVRLDLPDGAADQVGLAADLALPAEGSPLCADCGVVEVVRALPLRDDVPSEAIALPLSGGPAHLRVELWWSGDPPRELLVEADGERRAARAIAAGGAPERVFAVDAEGAFAGSLSHAAIQFDLGGDPASVRLRALGGSGLLWARLAVRQPWPPTGQSPEADPEREPAAPFRRGTEEELGALSVAVSEATASGSPADEAEARLGRAALLLGDGLPGYAMRDVEAARAILGRRGEWTDRLERLARSAREHGGHGFARVDAGAGVTVLPLAPGAAAGSGPPRWLDELAPDDPARRIAAGDPGGAEWDGDLPAAIHLEMARRAWTEAATDPRAALPALLHASAARAVIDDGEAARIALDALRATRLDPLSTAEQSADRARLSFDVEVPDRATDKAAWARRVVLGAGMARVDRVLAAGTRWVIDPGSGSPADLVLEATCDDMRHPRPGDPETCRLLVTSGDREEPPWDLPRGRVGRLAVRHAPGEALRVALEAGGHARYAAVALGSTSGDWRPPAPSAWYHVATPGEPVRYRVVAPTLLDLRLSPRRDEAAPEVLAEILVDGEPRLSQRWSQPLEDALAPGGGQAFGAPRRLSLPLTGDASHDVEVRASGGRVAVLAARRVAGSVIVPEPAGAGSEPLPEAAPADVGTDPLPCATEMPADLGQRPGGPGGLRRPLPARWGAVEAQVWASDRASLDAEELGAHVPFVGLSASHHLRAGSAESWFEGGALVRLYPRGRPVAGLALGTEHRLRPAELRVQGRAQGLLQATPDGTVGSLELSARLDRPTRLGPGLTLVPHVAVRGFVQPRRALRWRDGEVDVEIASGYRAAHPFGLLAGIDLLWRPWVNGEWVLGAGLLTNPEVISADSAGARLELRLHPRPVGIALAFDLSRRFRDDWRRQPWWRAEAVADLWLDLGPPELWIRPSLRVAWLVQPARLEATIGLSVMPGRRAIHHVAPGDLLFGDLREPEPAGGRWRR